MTDLEQLREDKKQVENAIHKLLFDFTEKYRFVEIDLQTDCVYGTSDMFNTSWLSHIKVDLKVNV